jgi:hypothetical protein
MATTGNLGFSIGYLFYESFLGTLYFIGGPSQLIGQSLSVLAFSLSVLIFIKFLYFFQIEKSAAIPVALFGLWPSGLIYTAGNYRESFELLFFSLSVFCCIKLQSSGEYRWFVYSMLSIIGLSLWHKALIVYSILLILLIIFFTWLRKNRPDTRQMSMTLPIMAGVSIIGATVFALSVTHVGRALVLDSLSGDLLQNVVNYRNWIDNLGTPRSAFNIELDTSSVLSSIVSFAEVYGYYMFAPFSGGIWSVNDLYAVLESSMRLGLVVLAAISTWAKNDRLDFVILWSVYISMTFMWAVGTTNSGQAIRHHVLTNWILILMAWPAVLYLIQHLRKRPQSQNI